MTMCKARFPRRACEKQNACGDFYAVRQGCRTLQSVKKGTIIMPFIIIAIFLAVAVLIWWIAASNKFRRISVKIAEAESGIDVALTKRFDVLTKQLDAAKAYAGYEKSTLLDIVGLRSGMSIAERSQANKSMDEAAKQISLLAESYPALGSNENFRQCQLAVTDVEEHLQAARRVYNSNVSAFNQAIAVFPGSVVAGAMKLSARPFFEAGEAKRQDVTLRF